MGSPTRAHRWWVAGPAGRKADQLTVVESCPFCTVALDHIWLECEHARAFADASPIADSHPIVVPRSRFVVYRTGSATLAVRADGSGQPETLAVDESLEIGTFSHDGRSATFVACGPTVISAVNSTDSPLKVRGPGSDLADHTLLKVTAGGALIIAGSTSNGYRFAELMGATNPSGWSGVLKVKNPAGATAGYILLYSNP